MGSNKTHPIPNKVAFFCSVLVFLENEVSLSDTLALNAPVVVPLEDNLIINKHDIIDLSIRYQFGNGYRNLEIKASIK